MNKRLREIRRILGMTAYDFGKKVNLSAITIKTLENSTKPITASIILKVCRAYSVNEQWLMYGEGDMFLPESVSAVTKLADEYQLSQKDEKFVETFVNLPASERDKIHEVIQLLSGKR